MSYVRLPTEFACGDLNTVLFRGKKPSTYMHEMKALLLDVIN